MSSINILRHIAKMKPIELSNMKRNTMINKYYMKKVTSIIILMLFGLTPLLPLVKIGGGELFVDVATRIERTSNVFSNNQEIKDFVWKFTPGLSFERKKGAIGLDAKLNRACLKRVKRLI